MGIQITKKISTVGSTLLEDNGKFLFVKSIGGGAAGFWNNPGGRLEAGESFEEAAIRETKEETGYDVVLKGVILTSNQDKGDHFVKKKVFLAKIIGGNLCIPEDEIKEARWFSYSEIISEKYTTFGCIQSIKDFCVKKFNQEYNVDVVS